MMIKDNITKMIIAATKERNKNKAEIYKSLKTAFINYESAKNAKPIDEAVEIGIIKKQKKMLEDVLPLFKEKGRNNLVDETTEQIKYLSELLPQEPTVDEIETYVKNKYPDGVEKKQMGVAIKAVKAHFAAAEGKTIANIIKKHLV